MNEKQKIAIVTGGGSGLGLAAAKCFTENNIRTVIIGRNEKNLAEAATTLGAALCSYKVFDLADLKNIPQLIGTICEEHGQIDILVNNAGINQKKPFVEVTDEDFLN